MAYVYRHIREDLNVPFYVGVGGLNNFDNYQRAKIKRNRTPYWNRIVNKTSYRVEIVVDDLIASEALEKEIEFIKLYGRSDLKEGTLVNNTDGGDRGFRRKISKEHKDKWLAHTKSKDYVPWNKGLKLSKEDRLKMSLTRKGKRLSDSHRINVVNAILKRNHQPSNSKLVLNLETGIFYDSIAKACKSIDKPKHFLERRLRGYFKNNTPFKTV